MKTYQLLATTVMAASAVLAMPVIATDQTVYNPRVEAFSQPATLSIEPGQLPQDARSVVLERIQRGELDVQALRQMSRDDMRAQQIDLRIGDPEAVRNITVLVTSGQAQAIAEQFGLQIEYQDSNTGMVVFDVGEHDDALALLSELRAHESVRAARASRTERRFELDVMRR